MDSLIRQQTVLMYTEWGIAGTETSTRAVASPRSFVYSQRAATVGRWKEAKVWSRKDQGRAITCRSANRSTRRTGTGKGPESLRRRMSDSHLSAVGGYMREGLFMTILPDAEGC
jgi:hypothetical protein